MIEIDACGLDCPEPVIMTKKALDENSKLAVIVDNEVAAENVSKLAKKLGCKVSIMEDGQQYKLTIVKIEDTENNNLKDKVGKTYFIKSNTLGEGSQELGGLLMKGFINTLLEVTPLPNKIIFINSGVKVPTLNKEAKENLKKLEDKGVTILACGTCLDYYELKDRLEVGNISNMYEILDSLNSEQIVEV